MSPSFSAPGFADVLNPDLLNRWNAEERGGSACFTPQSTDPVALRHPVPRFGKPAEPEFFFDRAAVERIRSGRRRPGLRQRLEFGPADDVPHFLDESAVVQGPGPAVGPGGRR